MIVSNSFRTTRSPLKKFSSRTYTASSPKGATFRGARRRPHSLTISSGQEDEQLTNIFRAAMEALFDDECIFAEEHNGGQKIVVT